MHTLVTMLTRFVGAASKATRAGGNLSQTFSAMWRTTRSLAGISLSVGTILGGFLFDGVMKVVDVFTSAISKTLGFNLSLSGLMDQAEEARRFFSELADEMNFYSSSTGSTKNAVNLLMDATSNSLATQGTLKSAFEGLVNAGVDTDSVIKDMLPTLGEFELKTGVAASQFSLLTGKFQQMFSEKKGAVKDIKNLQKALIGTGLKGSQLEQTMQGLTEAAEKLAFATRGDTMDIKKLSTEYGKTVATFKAFGISAQTTTTFLNGLLDPENVEKNMLLMNKMGISYGEFNDMLNSGKGQEKFFDKVLNNVGQVAQEASVIQDASTRFKYLKDTLGLPPEIANKLMKVSPHRMQSELRKIKKEMDEAEKQDKWRKDLKAKEEKYEEQMKFLRMEMVAPLVEIIQSNRTGIANFMKAIKPVIKGIASMLKTFLKPLSAWFDIFSKNLNKLTDAFGKMDEDAKAEKIADFIKENIGGLGSAIKKSLSDLWNSDAVQNIVLPLANAIGDILKTSIEYAIEYVKGNEITWEEASKKVKKTNQVQSKVKTLENLGVNTGFGAKFDDDGELILNKKAEFMVSAIPLLGHAIGKGGKQAAIMRSMKDNLSTAGFYGSSDYAFGDKTSGVFRHIGDEKLQKDLDESLSEFTRNFILGGEGSEDRNKELTKKMAKMFEDRIKIEQDPVNKKFLIANYENFKKMLNIDSSGSQEKIENTDAKAPDTITTYDAARNVANATPAEFRELTKKLIGDKNFIQAVSGSITTAKDSRIGELKKEIQEQNVQIKSSSLNIKKLEKNLENLKQESSIVILRDMKTGLLGKTSDSVSIKQILLNIEDVLVEDSILAKKNQKRKVAQGSEVLLNKNDLNAINSSTSGSTIAGSSSTSRAAANTKNIQAKQTLFLKSIADSTHDSAVILRYLGKNFVFTKNGLLVKRDDSIKSDLRDRYGTKVDAKTMNNFGVIIEKK